MGNGRPFFAFFRRGAGLPLPAFGLLAAAAMRSMETPMPKALIWLNTMKDITSTIRALASVMVPPCHSRMAASIMPTPASCSTASCAMV